MTDEESTGKKALKGAGRLAAMFGAELAAGLLQFLILGVLLLVAVGLYFVTPWLGIVFGVVSFIVWSVKTGWTFW